MFNKSIVGVIILLFILSSSIPFVSSYEVSSYNIIYVDDITSDYTNIENNLDNGSLSGFVIDIYENYIEGARIRVSFHDTYVENYSNSYGYYHVTNIPICFCLKNATVYKTGYKSEWVLLAIGENTIYNFTLIPIDNPPPDTPVITGPSSGKAGDSYNYLQIQKEMMYHTMLIGEMVIRVVGLGCYILAKSIMCPISGKKKVIT